MTQVSRRTIQDRRGGLAITGTGSFNATISGTLTGTLSGIGGGGGGGGIGLAAGTQLALAGLVYLSNSNNISFGMDASTVTASFSQSVQPGIKTIADGIGGSVTNGQILFANGNGITFGINAGTLTASHNGLTSQSTAPAAISAGTQLVTAGTVVFAAGNGVSFGMNASTVTASVDAIKSVSAGTTRVTNGELILGNANGLSFGVNGQTITGSYTQSTAPAAIAAAGGTATAGTVLFSNSHNVSFGMNAGTVTASASYSQSTAPGGIAAGTQTATAGTVLFADSNGLSFGMSASTRITASVDAIKSLSAGTTRVTNGEAVFGNANGVSFGANGQTITASYTQSTAPAAFAAGTQTATAATIVFSDSNGLTFGMSGSSRVTASHDGLRSVSAGTQDANVTHLVFANSNGVSFGLNNGTITATVTPGAAAGIAAASAGTQLQTAGTLVFANSNGLTFGMSGSSQVTVSADQRWAEVEWNAVPPHLVTAITNFTATGVTNRPLFTPLDLDRPLTWNRAYLNVSRATTGSDAFTITAGVYSFVNPTSAQTIATGSASYSNTATASNSGLRSLILPQLTAASALLPGRYVFGILMSAAATASQNYTLRGASSHAQLGLLGPGADQYTTATTALTQIGIPYLGAYSTTTNALPANLLKDDVRHWTDARPYQLNLAST